MRITKGRELAIDKDWHGFRMYLNKQELTTDQLVAAQEIIVAIALLDIQSELELKTIAKPLCYTRVIAKIQDLN